MLVYINGREDEELNHKHEYAYVYEYDGDYEDEEDANTEVNEYEITYEVSEDGYLVSNISE